MRGEGRTRAGREGWGDGGGANVRVPSAVFRRTVFSHMVSSCPLFAFAIGTTHLPPCEHLGSSHLGSIPSLKRWKSTPAFSLLGGTTLLYKLRYAWVCMCRPHRERGKIMCRQRYRTAPGHGTCVPQVRGRFKINVDGDVPPKVLDRPKGVDLSERLAPRRLLLPPARVVEPQCPGVLERMLRGGTRPYIYTQDA